MNFIKASEDFCTLEKRVPAPYFRRNFTVSKELSGATLTITGLGYYKAFINGKEITKGFLAPYRSNIDHYIYCDKYDLTDILKNGKNTLGIVLGNGLRNAWGGFIWDFDKAVFRGAPITAFSLELLYSDGAKETIISDSQTKTAPSPILYDDLHTGEMFDARLQIPDWASPDYEDGNWSFALKAEAPRGELKICEAEPITVAREIKPVKIFKADNMYIYDFGINSSGVCRLKINGENGQEIVLQYFEELKDGKPVISNLRFRDCDTVQEDRYICKGGEIGEYTPSFTYHGFRYVAVSGITEAQATEDLLTYLEMYSNIEKVGEFSCSDETVNKIQEATVRSDYSNFWYFPTDCPQREKNGWTGDASLSAEQMLYNMKPEKSFKEWLRNIYKAMSDKGEIPGIIPTADWGYLKGNSIFNGPAWDAVIINLPYYMYIYRGDTEVLKEAATPIMRYLNYLASTMTERDTYKVGLGDWCQVREKGNEWGRPSVSSEVVLTITAYDLAKKSAFIFGALGLETQKQFAESLASRLKKAFRDNLVDKATLTVEGDTQTGQAMALYYGMFEDDEKSAAFERLLEFIRLRDGHFHGGVLGGRVIYRLLAENGEAELAYNMIVRPDFPSYGNWIARGATTLWEEFYPEEGEGDLVRISSHNHHFWGDVSAWFYRYLAGINVNPQKQDANNINIEPVFIGKLDFVKASYTAKDGTVAVDWKRNGDTVVINIELTGKVYGKIILPNGFAFEDNSCEKELKTAEYTAFKLEKY